MYYKLTDAIINRFIWELRKYWSTHPKYKQDLVENIQGKYSFKERPQFGMIVKGGSASGIHFSPDNYIGTIVSHISLKTVGNYPGLSIEWIHEDERAIQDNGGVFPSLPGIYYIDLTSEDEFYVDCLLDVNFESILMTTSTEGVLAQGKFQSGTLRIYEQPSGILYYEGTDYTADPNTGVITLTKSLPSNTFISADYRYPGKTTGPHKIYTNRANNTAIPGAVLFFGNRTESGDKLAIVVERYRSPVSLEYGGRWSLNVDIDIMARDVHSQREISDKTLIYLWGIARSYLSSDGIELTDLSLGGESEEIYDDNADDYFYNSSMSATVEAEWLVRVPLGPKIRQVIPMTKEQAESLSGMTDEELRSETGTIRVAEGFELHPFTDPFFVGRGHNFEMIK